MNRNIFTYKYGNCNGVVRYSPNGEILNKKRSISSLITCKMLDIKIVKIV